MALFKKQDFTPSVLSRKWIAMQFRPNMLIHSQENVVSILESGLLFREDSIDVEQEAQWWMDETYGSAWLTTGEQVASTLAVGVMIYMLPVRSIGRGGVYRASAWLATPLAVRAMMRWRGSGGVQTLLRLMCDYLTVSRRAAVCCREYRTLYAQLESAMSVVESTQALLIQQQVDLATLLSRTSSALLGHSPWLTGDVAWEIVCRPGDSLMKIHHTFLVVQSLFLKYLAMAHYMPPNKNKVYKNHNERIYWLHNTVIKHLISEYKGSYEALERMYRLLKNCGTVDQTEAKKPGAAITDSWVYSEVHIDVAKSCLELKIALSKSTAIDMFLDSCGTNRIEVDLDVLNKDIDVLIDNITKCLTTAQNSQIRLKKLQSKLKAKESNNTEVEVIEDNNIVKIDDKAPEAKDEVFYCVKTEDDDGIPQAQDVTTGPGAKEKETSKVVLSELKRKLGKREDMMRERERQALMKTMPQYRDNVPEFPRQIQYKEFVERKGFCKKIMKEKPKSKLFKNYKISRIRKDLFKKGTKFITSAVSYLDENDIVDDIYEANTMIQSRRTILTILQERDRIIVTRWHKIERRIDNEQSDALSNAGSTDSRNEYVNRILDAYDVDENMMSYVYTRHDSDVTPTTSEEELRGRLAILDEARRHRGVNNHYRRREFDEMDESLRPIEYRFGTGMAMASVLQGNGGKVPAMVQEEVFVGDGEVSDDSGNNDEN